MFWSIAYAQESAPAAPGFFEQMLPFLFLFLIFYFLMIRPQSKKLKQHQLFLQNLKKGDSVITTGGILGEVVGLTPQFVTLEIDNNVKIRVVRQQIAGSSASESSSVQQPKENSHQARRT